MLNALRSRLILPAPGRLYPEGKLIEALLAQVEVVPHPSKRCWRGDAREALPRLHKRVTDTSVEALAELFKPFFYFVLCRRDQFSRSGWGGRAQIGDKIRNREISLVPDRGDDWQLGCRDRACQKFAVERREVFECSAAPGQHDDVNFARAVEVA